MFHGNNIYRLPIIFHALGSHQNIRELQEQPLEKVETYFPDDKGTHVVSNRAAKQGG